MWLFFDELKVDELWMTIGKGVLDIYLVSRYVCGNPHTPFPDGVEKKIVFFGFHIGHPLLQIAASCQELLKHVKSIFLVQITLHCSLHVQLLRQLDHLR